MKLTPIALALAKLLDPEVCLAVCWLARFVAFFRAFSLVESKLQYSHRALQSLRGAFPLQPFAMFSSILNSGLKNSFFSVLLKSRHFFPADLITQSLHKGSILKYICNLSHTYVRINKSDVNSWRRGSITFRTSQRFCFWSAFLQSVNLKDMSPFFTR